MIRTPWTWTHQPGTMAEVREQGVVIAYCSTAEHARTIVEVVNAVESFRTADERTFAVQDGRVDEAPRRATDEINHPQHYTDVVPGVECITVVEHFGFLRGNAIKYLWRAGAKGDALVDLRKARWYVDREIANLETQREGGAST